MATSMVVIGMGNALMSNDGVGVRALGHLVADPRMPPRVTLVDGGSLGLELLGYAAHASHLLLLDAVDVGSEPGSVVRLDTEALAGLPAHATGHQLGVAELLAALRMREHRPVDVVVLGVQPHMTSLGAGLCFAARAAVRRLVDAAVTQLRHWDDGPSGPFDA